MSTFEELKKYDSLYEDVVEGKECLENAKYNMAMIKCRQALEEMVRVISGADEYESLGLEEMIDQLYVNKIITECSKNHYHKIRIIGNKAVHHRYKDERDAKYVYQILENEIKVFLGTYVQNNKQYTSKAHRKNAPKNVILRNGIIAACLASIITIGVTMYRVEQNKELVKKRQQREQEYNDRVKTSREASQKAFEEQKSASQKAREEQAKKNAEQAKKNAEQVRKNIEQARKNAEAAQKEMQKRLEEQNNK